MRRLECELALLEKPDGSAVFQQGDSKVMCAVYGPTEVKLNREIIDKATLDCILKPKVGMAGVKEKLFEEVITKTCEQVVLTKLHPRSAMQIVLQVVQDSGSLLSCLINGACMAMVHTGLPMRNMVVAVCCGISHDEEYLVDPSNIEEKNARCLLTFSFECQNYGLISSHTTGNFSIEEYFKCLKLARTSAEHVALFQRQSIVRFLSKDTVMVEDEVVEEMAEETDTS